MSFSSTGAFYTPTGTTMVPPFYNTTFSDIPQLAPTLARPYRKRGSCVMPSVSEDTELESGNMVQSNHTIVSDPGRPPRRPHRRQKRRSLATPNDDNIPLAMLAYRKGYTPFMKEPAAPSASVASVQVRKKGIADRLSTSGSSSSSCRNTATSTLCSPTEKTGATIQKSKPTTGGMAVPELEAEQVKLEEPPLFHRLKRWFALHRQQD
ncbi:uncharacterized protein BYT42DRAFT_569462 [Radiomyces spectabilis]|uniref:uncharacterized protein n=1 Tax=Radiomyces spectabilis TaxID=64574 RepID=UPI00221F6A99|nr:uncharacterized protein BYT42DRAFT_569462 [Radiomyces spectabilis]KAI8379634.1 hypothetical protein BYT42DRAFT_569462 [Radiomyces spectabilis]